MTVPACLVSAMVSGYVPGSIAYGPGTYSFTVPAGVYNLVVNMVAPGGGGGGRADGSNGSNGGNTVVGSLTATGGYGGTHGVASNGGANGTPGSGGSPGGIGGTGKNGGNTASPNPNLPGYGYGGAGAYDNGQWGSGAGGGSGGYYANYNMAVTPGQVISITVSAGGLAGSPCATTCAAAGGDGRVTLSW